MIKHIFKKILILTILKMRIFVALAVFAIIVFISACVPQLSPQEYLEKSLVNAKIPSEYDVRYFAYLSRSGGDTVLKYDYNVLNENISSCKGYVHSYSDKYSERINEGAESCIKLTMTEILNQLSTGNTSETKTRVFGDRVCYYPIKGKWNTSRCINCNAALLICFNSKNIITNFGEIAAGENCWQLEGYPFQLGMFSDKKFCSGDWYGEKLN